MTTLNNFPCGSAFHHLAFRAGVLPVLAPQRGNLNGVATLKATSSLVFHPTQSSSELVPERFLLREGELLAYSPKQDQDESGTLSDFASYLQQTAAGNEDWGGVGILLAKPSNADDTSSPIHTLVDQILTNLNSHPNKQRSAKHAINTFSHPAK